MKNYKALVPALVLTLGLSASAANAFVGTQADNGTSLFGLNEVNAAGVAIANEHKDANHKCASDKCAKDKGHHCAADKGAKAADDHGHGKDASHKCASDKCAKDKGHKCGADKGHH
jgi:hypothetical protein